MAVGANIVFDPTREELAVADAVVAVSVGGAGSGDGDGSGNGVRVLGVRTIDPPSRLTPKGLSDKVNSATGGKVGSEEGEGEMERGVVGGGGGGRRGGGGGGLGGRGRGERKRGVVGRMVKMVVEKGGVGEEVLGGLEGVDVG